MRKCVSRIFLFVPAVIFTVVLMSGCATPRRTTETTAAPPSGASQGEFLKGMEVVEQPELEPDWANWVKDYYPHWRKHYWVDRGQWGNRGYIVGKPPAAAEPVVETEVTPLPPVAPAIVESEPPKVETPEKPTKYVVKKGDSLWRIAGKVYHNPLKWHRIYKANKDKIKNPNRIYPGMVLTIPQN
jgi:nucleoid-associated protein YgaU